MIGISACLGGLACRYDGQKEVPELMELVETGEAVMVCPEVIGGLPIPRIPLKSLVEMDSMCGKIKQSMDDKRRRCNGSVQKWRDQSLSKIAGKTH